MKKIKNEAVLKVTLVNFFFIFCFLLMPYQIANCKTTYNLPATENSVSPEFVNLYDIALSPSGSKIVSYDYLNVANYSKDEVSWPLRVFLIGEIYFKNKQYKKAYSCYKLLIEWASKDVYNDTFGGTGLLAISFYRYIDITIQNGLFNPKEIDKLISLYRQLDETRFMRSIFNSSSNVYASLPQLEPDILRMLTQVCRRADRIDDAFHFFIRYLFKTSDPDLTEDEKRLFHEILERNLASQDWIDLLRGRYYYRLRNFEKAKKFFLKIEDSDDIQKRAEALYYLARIERSKGFNRVAIVSLLNEAYEDAEDPDLIQEILYFRALAYNRPGKGRNFSNFIQDLITIVNEFPGGKLVDDALHQLAHKFSEEGNIEKALTYYNQLSSLEIHNNWKESALFKPAFLLYKRKESHDLNEAFRLFSKYIEEYPYGAYTLVSMFWSARIKEENGDFDISSQLFKKIINIAPYNYYSIRSQMHLEYGKEARYMLLPGQELYEEYKKDWEVSRNQKLSISDSSPYAKRINQSLQSGLYFKAKDAESILESKFPKRRKQDITIQELENNKLLIGICILIALRQDAFVAADICQDYSDIVNIAHSLGVVVEEWPVSLEVIMSRNDGTKGGYFIQKAPGYLSTAYPRVFNNYIHESSIRNNISSELLFSVVRNESQFHSRAYSKRGAIGLFQFIPPTFKSLDKKWNLLFNSKINTVEEYLYSPEYSIRLGGKYFKDELFRRYNNDVLPEFCT